MFPFPGKKKEKQPIELKIELSAGQGCGLEGGDAPSWGRAQLWLALALRGRAAVWAREAVLAKASGHQLTWPGHRDP